MSVNIKHFFDPQTNTFSYVISDPNTSATAIIDSVQNYDQYSGRTSTSSVDEIVEYISSNNLNVEWILETHIHADHLTASNILKSKLGGKTGIGSSITEVLKFWTPIFNTQADTAIDASQFDRLFTDQEIIRLGNINIKIIHTPGHTQACVSYLVEDAIFVGDTIFMPDVGTARTDFPGGSAETLYNSIQKILNLPDNTRIFTCHDYPPETRQESCESTVLEQKQHNVLINSNISKQKYITIRNKRDAGKPVPKLLLPSIQVNLRLGSFGQAEDNGVKYIKIPVDKI